MTYLRSIGLFIAAGLAEIGGGYLVWLWLREGRAAVLGALGGGVLFVYGVLPTLQPLPSFGRIYAAYGGWFVVLSLLWGWLLANEAPDRFDIVGAGVVLAGVGIIAYAPR